MVAMVIPWSHIHDGRRDSHGDGLDHPGRGDVLASILASKSGFVALGLSDF